MKSDPTSIPQIPEMQRARARLGDLVVTTPLWRSQSLAKRLFGDDSDQLFLKLELLQHAGSFKPRGALCVMLELSTSQLARGVTAVSAGNHAIAVGYAAKVLGTTAKVVMHRRANPARVARCRAFGAEVILEDDIHQAFDRVRQIERDEGRVFVHPFEGPLTALGTATLGMEICEQAKDCEAVIVPIGGGGLCAGIAAAVKQLQPDCQVFGVEPEGANTMALSFASGKPEAIDQVRSIADSLGAPHAAPYSFGLCRRFVDELVQVRDEDLCRAMALLFHETKLAVEPAGAATVAALAGPLRDRLRGKRIVCVISGTNIDAVSFHKFLAQGEAQLS